MTTVQYILIIIAVVIMMVGLYMIIRGFLNRRNDSAGESDVQYKDGVPIIPRHERHIEEESIDDIELDEEITIAPDRDELQPIKNGVSEVEEFSTTQETRELNLETDHRNQPNFIQRDAEVLEVSENQHSSQELNAQQDTFDSLNDQGQPAQLIEKTEQPLEQQDSIASQSHSSNKLSDPHHIHQDNEDDLFSSLASATESLMPVIQTAQEPNFDDNSPVLDGHLLAEVDHDQNNPLNNAQENINITLVPKNNMEMIYGKTVLELVNQYGLKYGAMNMFHRYENKDGTGILWFSMMGITEEGDITPFDLNVLPSSRFKGLVLFLSLPHPKAMQGFDSMMSVVNLISNDLNTLVLDENNQELTRERRQQLRAQVQEYQATHN